MPPGRNIAEETYDLMRTLPRLNISNVGPIAGTAASKVIFLKLYSDCNNQLIRVGANDTFVSE